MKSVCALFTLMFFLCSILMVECYRYKKLYRIESTTNDKLVDKYNCLLDSITLKNKKYIHSLSTIDSIKRIEKKPKIIIKYIHVYRQPTFFDSLMNNPSEI